MDHYQELPAFGRALLPLHGGGGDHANLLWMNAHGFGHKAEFYDVFEDF